MDEIIINRHCVLLRPLRNLKFFWGYSVSLCQSTYAHTLVVMKIHRQLVVWLLNERPKYGQIGSSSQVGWGWAMLSPKINDDGMRYENGPKIDEGCGSLETYLSSKLHYALYSCLQTEHFRSDMQLKRAVSNSCCHSLSANGWRSELVIPPCTTPKTGTVPLKCAPDHDWHGYHKLSQCFSFCWTRPVE